MYRKGRSQGGNGVPGYESIISWSMWKIQQNLEEKIGEREKPKNLNINSIEVLCRYNG